MTSILKAFLSGGASYVLLIMGGLILAQYWQISGLKKNYATTIAERDAARALVKEKDTLIASQTHQFQRQINSYKDEERVQKLITNVPDTYFCSDAPAIHNAVEWLRDRENREQTNDNDKSDVSVSDKTGASKR